LPKCLAISKNLYKLEEDGYIEPGFTRKVFHELRRQLSRCEAYRNLIRSTSEFTRARTGAKKDYAFAILIYLLVRHTTHLTGNPHYKELSDFIAERGIRPDNDDTYDNLATYVRRLDIRDLMRMYKFVFWNEAVMSEDGEVPVRTVLPSWNSLAHPKRPLNYEID
jgi:hypothetical protein